MVDGTVAECVACRDNETRRSDSVSFFTLLFLSFICSTCTTSFSSHKACSRIARCPMRAAQLLYASAHATVSMHSSRMCCPHSSRELPCEDSILDPGLTGPRCASCRSAADATSQKGLRPRTRLPSVGSPRTHVQARTWTLRTWTWAACASAGCPRACASSSRR